MKYLSYAFLFIIIISPPISGHTDTLSDGFKAFEKKNYKQAYKIWKPLADAGNADAQYNIGLLLKNGKGVTHDHRKALFSFLAAAKQGHAEAQYNAGMMFRLAQGISRSNKDAVIWWQRAAAQGLTEAQHNLAVMYAYGMGTGVNNEEAVKLWRLAAKKGYEESSRALYLGYTKGYFGLKKDPEIAKKYWPVDNSK
ncbi:MAG: tetratricopeptide repeat protein [Thiohalomonadales bacterium]